MYITQSLKRNAQLYPKKVATSFVPSIIKNNIIGFLRRDEATIKKIYGKNHIEEEFLM